MMEVDQFAAPRLARAFYGNGDCWSPLILSASLIKEASDPINGQAPKCAEISVPAENLQEASDPIYGQALIKAEFNLQAANKQASELDIDGQASSTIQASDPVDCGQANSSQDQVSGPKDGQAKIQQKGDLLNSKVVNSNLHLLSALCGLQVKSLQDISLLQKGTSLMMEAFDAQHGQASNTFMAASDPSRQAALCANLLSITAQPCPSSPSVAHSALFAASPPTRAYSVTSPSHQHYLHKATLFPTPSAIPTLSLAIPVLSTPAAIPPTTKSATPTLIAAIPMFPTPSATPTCYSLHVAIPLLPANPDLYHPIPAIPILLSSPSTTPSSRWHDKVSDTLSTISIASTLIGTSKLRAHASPWQPSKPTLPSLLVGDIPLTPLLPSSMTKSTSSLPLEHPLLLPGSARQSLARLQTSETLVICLFCGHTPHFLPDSSLGSPATFTFSPLKGESVKYQAGEAKVLAN